MPQNECAVSYFFMQEALSFPIFDFRHETQFAHVAAQCLMLLSTSTTLRNTAENQASRPVSTRMTPEMQ